MLSLESKIKVSVRTKTCEDKKWQREAYVIENFARYEKWQSKMQECNVNEDGEQVKGNR